MKTITNEKHDPRFYVTSPLWTVEPLTISETKHNDGRVRFYVHPREGGPAFDYLARCQRSDPNGQQIVPSWFSDYPTYQSATNNQAKLVRSPEMASAYKDVQRFLSRCGVRTDVLETHKPGPFALKDALAAYANGAWFRVGDWHHVPRMKANKCFQQE